VPNAVPHVEACPLIKCRANCGDAGYQIDEQGCQTCHCTNGSSASKTNTARKQCSLSMCRMFCVHGFRRNEDGCEICQCNDKPEPCPSNQCDSPCPNGYRNDYSGKKRSNEQHTSFQWVLGCPTCTCAEEKVVPVVNVDGCAPMRCARNCKYGFESDLAGCPLCSCNKCPQQLCRMFCMYGFKKNADGCDVCECNWSPVAENIQCSEVSQLTMSNSCLDALRYFSVCPVRVIGFAMPIYISVN
jgi:hypothetical protein